MIGNNNQIDTQMHSGGHINDSDNHNTNLTEHHEVQESTQDEGNEWGNSVR